MPYYLEKKNNKFKLRLKSNPNFNFSNKYMTKKQAIKQMKAIEISKKQRGSGLFQRLRKGLNFITTRIISIPLNTINNQIQDQLAYIDSVKDILKKYGNFRIVKMLILKQPVDGKIINFGDSITNSQLTELMIKANIDSYFHISMRVDVLDDIDNIYSFLIEKNENIKITPYKFRPNTQEIQVDLNDNNQLTMNIILTKTRLAIGEQTFFEYRFDSSNCANFILEILRANNLLTKQLEAFIFQNTDVLKNGLDKQNKNNMHAITRIAARIGHITGKGFENFRFL